MPQVGTLTVDLVANTATFTSDMGKASKAAEDFGKSAKDAGEKTDYSMMEARHGVQMLGEEFNVRLPRGITSFIASIGPVGAAMESAFPFLAIAVGAKILIDHFAKMHEAAEKVEFASVNFGNSILEVFSNLDDKLLQAGIKSDELANDHLGALKKQLELIDHQSMKELATEFGIISKSAEVMFADMKSQWFQFAGSTAGASHALKSFKSEYDTLLAQGKDKEASDLLAGTLASAEKIQALQRAALNNPDRNAQKQAIMELEQINKQKGQNISLGKDDLASQQSLVDALRAQVTVEEKVAALKKAQQADAEDSADKKIGADADKAFRRQAEEAKQEADQAEKEFERTFKEAVERLQESERMKIDATKKGSIERLAVIDAAIKEENSKGLQATGFYRGLLVERVNITREMADQEAKITESLATEELKYTSTMAKLATASAEEAAKHRFAMGQATRQQELAAEIKAVQDELQVELAGYDKKIAGLNRSNAEELVKITEFEHKKQQIKAQSALAITKLENAAAQQQFHDISGAEQHIADAIAKTAAQSIMSGKDMGDAFRQLGLQMSQQALQDVLQLETIEGRKRLMQSKGAARAAYVSIMEHIPEPLSAVLAPIGAAAAFAGVMAFELGGQVPGMGPVPAVVHGGETVVTKALTDRVEASEGRGQRTPQVTNFHIHVKDVDGFKASQSQIISKQQNAADRAARRNGKR